MQSQVAMMNHRWLLAAVVTLTACSSEDDGDDDVIVPPVPVYYGQVDKILNDNCVGCHSEDPDRLAPFSLAGYDAAALAAEAAPIAYAVMNRLMPPYYADDSGACQTFKGNHWLSDADIATLVEWVNGARTAGDPAQASPPPLPLPELAGVDAVADPGADYTPDQAVADDFRCFLIDAPAATDQFLTAYHVRPGNPTVVHHVIAFTLATATAESDAEQLDAAAPGVGYPCNGGTGVVGSQWLVGWAPGAAATFLPPDTGIRVPGGRKLILQIHYNLANSDGMPDHTTIDLDLSAAVANEARIIGVAAPVSLPPGQPDVATTGSITIPAAIPEFRVWSAAVHMHQRGLAGTRVREARTDTCLVDYVNWSFHWQHAYQYEQPVTLRGGDTLEITCHYDTTEDNVQVTWGEGTGDEMCLAIMLASP